jgi:hypothetical protein
MSYNIAWDGRLVKLEAVEAVIWAGGGDVWRDCPQWGRVKSCDKLAFLWLFAGWLLLLLLLGIIMFYFWCLKNLKK